MNKEKTKVPDGYMENGQGNLVPIGNVRELDKLRNELVNEIMGMAMEAADYIAELKRKCQDRVTGFVALAAQEHGMEYGGEKGNVTLTSYDGKRRIIRAMDDVITFNEGVTVAREIILKLVGQWSEGANANITALVHKAFETDRNGHLSAAKLMGLYSVKIEDAEWEKAMKAIRESVQVVSTKSYIRFYERDADGKWVQVALG